GPDVCVLSPPVATRRWNATPFPDVTATSACRDPGVSVSRIMTPALAHGSVLCTPVTRTTICPSPVSGTHTYWKASAVAQMSVPDARSVNVPFAIVALPGTPTLPTSWLVHAFGSVVVVVVAGGAVEVVVVVGGRVVVGGLVVVVVVLALGDAVASLEFGLSPPAFGPPVKPAD